MTAAIDWPRVVLYVFVGVGALLAGIGVMIVCNALAGVLKRVNVTLDEVDRQIGALGTPVAATLSHVDGIAGTADTTIARLSGVITQVENVAERVGHTANLASSAVSPSLINLGATLTGITAGLRRLVVGRRAEQPEPTTLGS